MSPTHTNPSDQQGVARGTLSGKYKQDAVVGVGLLLALGIVFALEPAPPKESVTEANPVVTVVNPPQVEPVAPPPRLGVVEGRYDDMGQLLKELGEAYHYDTITLDDLLEPENLSEYEIIFLCCGTVPESWLGGLIGKGTRNGTEVRQWKTEFRERLNKSLRGFVEGGGTLYASDWRFSFVGSAFPEFVDGEAIAEGDRQEVTADVTDAGLRELLGAHIQLRFDLAGWSPAAFLESQVTTYLKGSYRTLGGEEVSAPLLVKFGVGDGTVIFTSFHNERQNSKAEELKLLRYLVFTAVTARVESQVTKTMLQGGFSPAKQNLLSASAGKLKVTKTYTCASRGELQFALGFEQRGAELKLEIVGPDGRTFERKGTSTFQINVPNAIPGDWKYTVTALKVPHENFPFTLTVGEKKESHR